MALEEEFSQSKTWEPWDIKSAFAVETHMLDISKRLFGHGVRTWDKLVQKKASFWASLSWPWKRRHLGNFPYISKDYHQRHLKWKGVTLNLLLHFQCTYQFYLWNVSWMTNVESRHKSLETEECLGIGPSRWAGLILQCWRKRKNKEF